jgi:hypothetical protein
MKQPAHQAFVLLAVSWLGSCGGATGAGLASPEAKNVHWTKIDGLEWSDKAAQKLGWLGAKAYCDGIGGRLPTLSQLRSVIAECPSTQAGGSCPAADSCLESKCRTNACTGCAEASDGHYSKLGDNDMNFLWSGSGVEDKVGNAWLVFPNSGNVNYFTGMVQSLVRCVR